MGVGHQDQDKDLQLQCKDQDKDQHFGNKDQDKDQDFSIKDQDKDKDYNFVLKESLRTRTRKRTNNTGGCSRICRLGGSGMATSKAGGSPPNPSPQMNAHVGLWGPPLGAEFEPGGGTGPSGPAYGTALSSSLFARKK